MAEYIDREVAKKALGDAHFKNYGNAIMVIMDIPTADVRSVVLCRNCIHFQQFREHDGFCQIDGMLWNNDFFCSNGKRVKS